MKEVSHKIPDIIKFYLYEVSRIDKSTETESSVVVVWGWEAWADRRLIAKGYMGVLKRQNVLKLTVVMVAQICEFTKIH